MLMAAVPGRTLEEYRILARTREGAGGRAGGRLEGAGQEGWTRRLDKKALQLGQHKVVILAEAGG